MSICTKNRSFSLVITLTGILLFTSCVETLITVQVFPDGRYSMSFLTKGDSTDVFNHDFPHPSGTSWITKIEKELVEEDEIWVMKTTGVAEGALLFTSRDDSLTALQHPIQIQRTEGFFATRYTLLNVFKGRTVYLKYPAFGKSLLESDNDSTRWLDEAFYYICASGIRDLQRDPETAIDPNISERVINHIHNTLARINQKKLYEELDDKLRFMDQMLRPFQNDLPIGYSTLLSHATDVYEEELRLTSELKDDQFQYWVFLPGVITSTNADTIAGDTLRWAFGINEYLNDDYIIEAASIVYSSQHIQLTILIAAGFLLIMMYFFYRKGR